MNTQIIVRDRNLLLARRRRPYRCRGVSRGVGLIEILVAVLIMAIGLLGIAALQATALRNSQSALQRSQATMQTYAILDAMRANRAVAQIGGYDLSMTCALPDAGALLREDDLHDWIASLKASLGDSACGMIDCDSLQCDITVQWDDSRGSDGSTAQTVSTSTRL